MSGESERFSARWLDPYMAMMTPGSLALDLGCGSGDDTGDLVDAGLRVVGLDKRRETVLEAAKRVPNADFVVADMTAGLPFR